MRDKFLTITLVLTTLLTGCKKLVEVGAPSSSLNAANVYETDATAIAVMTGIYTGIAGSALPDGSNLSLCLGLSADEFILYPGVTSNAQIGFYKNNLTALSGLSPDFWRGYYNMIFSANAALEGIEASKGLTPAVKQQLLGEAKFIRAYSYFNLVNLFGDLPLVTTSNYTVNAVLARSPAADIWKLMISDLTDAQKLLSESFLDATLLKTSTERVRPSKWAATALLARALLYTGDYTNAATQAGALIDNATLFGMSTVDNAFLRASLGNKEAIWQIQSIYTGYNTQEARLFIIPSTGPAVSWPVYLSDDLLAAFEPGDKRRDQWVGNVTAAGSTYYFPFKYKQNLLNAPLNEYSTVFRLAEQYLIRAEARLQKHDVAGAKDDINQIRTRAGLSPLTTTSEAVLTDSLLHERRIELFAEWGHRWLDIKRTGKVDAIMQTACTVKGGTWNTNWQLYPISATELKSDPFLIQNKGY